MSKICPNCFYIGKGKYSNWLYKLFFADIYTGIILLAIGIAHLIRNYDVALVKTGLGIFLYVLMNIFLFLPLIWGTFNIVNYFKGGKTCPKCNKKGMISIDNPEAIEIIKEKNLSVPKESP